MAEEVVIPIQLDIAGFNAQLDQVKNGMKTVENASDKTSNAIQSNAAQTTAALNKTKSVSQQLSGAFAKLGITIGAAFAVRAVLNFAKESVKAYRQAQAAEAKLLAALNGRADVQERLVKLSQKIQKATIFGDEEVQAAASFLAIQGRTEDQINKTINAAVDLSAVTGDDLNTSVRKLDMTYEGQLGRLGRLDSSLKDLTESQLRNGAAIDILGSKYKGMAEAMAKTDEGKLKQLTNAYGDLKEAIGEGMSNALANGAARLKTWVTSLTEAIKPDISQRLDQQKKSFEILAQAAIKEGLTKERRIELVKQMQAIEPGFLKGLDLERVTVNQIAAAYKNSIDLFNTQIEAKKFAINIERQYNELAANQATIDANRADAANLLAEGTGNADINMRNALATSSEYVLTAVKWIAPWTRVGGVIDKTLAKTLIADANLRESDLKTQQQLISMTETMKTLAADGWDKTTIAVQQTERIMRQLGASDGEIAKIIEYFKQLNKEMAGGAGSTEESTEQVTGATKEAQTAYQKLTEEIGKLNEKLLDQILTGKGDIETTKQQIIQKTELRNRVDMLNDAFNEQLELLGRINELESKPQLLEIPTGEELPGLAKLESTYTEQFTQAGENAGKSFWGGFTAFLGSIDPEDVQIKDAIGQLAQSLTPLFEMLFQFDDSALKALDGFISDIEDRISATEEAIKTQEQLLQEGSAANLAVKKDELNALQQQREAYLAEREKELEKERQLERTSATIAASVGAIKLLANAVSTEGVAGLILGVAAVATFLTSLAQIQNDASGSIKFAHGTQQILGGNSHAGGGVRLGSFGEAEKGEFLGIMSSINTKKYGKSMLSLFEGLNSGNQSKAAAGLLGLATGIIPEGGGSDQVELKEVKEVREIRDIMKKGGKTVTYEDKKRIERGGTHTRIINKN